MFIKKMLVVIFRPYARLLSVQSRLNTLQFPVKCQHWGRGPSSFCSLFYTIKLHCHDVNINLMHAQKVQKCKNAILKNIDPSNEENFHAKRKKK